jgi:hypothetical protein
MIFKYKHAVVFTPGRTGSQLIVNNIQTCFNISVTHTHNPLLEVVNNDTIAFVSRRRNVFESVASTLLGKRSNEYTSYTTKSVEKFIVGRTEFEDCFWFHKCFYQLINRSKFEKVVDVWFEDLINDPKYLFNLLDMDRLTDYNFPKSPRNYYELISNIDQCQMWYDDLKDLTASDTLLELFRKTIINDLNSIQ